MQMTTIERNNCTNAMRAMVLRLLPSMAWRHHGIGCLQGYVVEGADPEVRIHIWSRQLVKPGMDESGSIHDHRFDLVSHVLAGSVGHEEIIPEQVDDGEFEMLALTHARAAKESSYHGPTKVLEGRYAARRNSFVIQQGHSYRFPAGRFHRSPVLGDVAVTCVEKHAQSDVSARLLYPIDKPPVMAFGHEMDWPMIGQVLTAATIALSRNP